MKNLKTIAYVILAIFILVFAWRYFKPTEKVITVTTPKDTTFSQVTHDTYRPNSVPLLESTHTPPTRLPSNLKPKDVKEVITVVKKPNDSTRVIITNNGNVYVDRQNGKVENVTVTTYEPPILNFDLFPKLGIDGNTQKVSPFIGIAFLEICGKVDLPLFTVDLYGIGIGIDYQLFNPVSIGVIYHDDWQTNKSIRLTLAIDL